MKKKFTFLIAMMMILVIGITGCSTEASLNEGVIAKVQDVEITEVEYNKLLDYYLSLVTSQYSLTDDMLNTADETTGLSLLDTLKVEVLDILILTEVIEMKAAENKIVVEEAELEESFQENHLVFMEEDEEYKKIIEENGLDEEFIKEQIRKDLLSFKYNEFFLEKLDINEAAAKTFYDDNHSQFHREEVSAKHILVEEEATAKEVIEKLNAGADFAELAKEYSIEPAAQTSGGDLGYFGRGKMVPAFEEAAFALEVGQISEPVKSDFGYHVIVVEDKIHEDTPFEDVKEDIITHLKGLEYQSHLQEALEKAKVVKKDKL